MPERRAAMRCPRCGATMNHHADKLQAPVDESEAPLIDAALGGLIQETHGCPACGNVEFRRAEDY